MVLVGPSSLTDMAVLGMVLVGPSSLTDMAVPFPHPFCDNVDVITGTDGWIDVSANMTGDVLPSTLCLRQTTTWEGNTSGLTSQHYGVLIGRKCRQSGIALDGLVVRCPLQQPEVSGSDPSSLGRPSRWASGQDVHLEIGRFGVPISLALGYFLVESYQRLKIWHSSGYSVRRLA